MPSLSECKARNDVARAFLQGLSWQSISTHKKTLCLLLEA